MKRIQPSAKQPVSHQELFESYIDAIRTVSCEFSGSIRHDAFALQHWARGYAKGHGLKLPFDPERYGIYYEPDAEEIAELRNEGLWPVE